MCIRRAFQNKHLKTNKCMFYNDFIKNCRVKKSTLRKLKRLQVIDFNVFLRTIKLCDSFVTLSQSYVRASSKVILECFSIIE